VAIKRNLPWAPLLALASSLGALAAVPEGAEPLPTPFPEARYQQMSERSPFAIATTAVAAATPGFAALLYVDGVAHVGNTDFVAIKSRSPDQQQVIFLAVGKSTDDGMKVEGVNWSDQLGKSTVDVSKDGEHATLLFDEETVKNPPAQLAPPNIIRLPNMPGQPRPMTFPVQNNNLRRYLLPQAAQMGPNAINPPMPPMGGIPHRVRGIIQSGQ